MLILWLSNQLKNGQPLLVRRTSLKQNNSREKKPNTHETEQKTNIFACRVCSAYKTETNEENEWDREPTKINHALKYVTTFISASLTVERKISGINMEKRIIWQEPNKRQQSIRCWRFSFTSMKKNKTHTQATTRAIHHNLVWFTQEKKCSYLEIKLRKSE